LGEKALILVKKKKKNHIKNPHFMEKNLTLWKKNEFYEKTLYRKIPHLGGKTP